MKRPVTIALCGLFLLTACKVPEIRLFEKEVPEPLTVTGDVREAWAVGAEWLEQDYAKGHPDPDKGRMVAVALSNSVGSPKAYEENYEKVIKELRKANQILKARLALVNGFLENQQGKTVEGTGFNLIGFTGSYWFWLCVVVLIVLAGGGPILIMVFRTMRSTLIQTTRAIEEWSRDDPEAAEKFKTQYASRRMDQKHKKVIRKHKLAAARELI